MDNQEQTKLKCKSHRWLLQDQKTGEVYCYSNTGWKLAWVTVWLIGVITGVIIGASFV